VTGNLVPGSCVDRVMAKTRVALLVVASWAGTARADQCEWVEPEQARAAARALARGVEYLQYCEPCGDTQPTRTATVDRVEVRAADANSSKQTVYVDDQPIDLAYVFVKVGKEYANVARLAGCHTSGVSRSITYPVVPAKTRLAPWYGRFSNGKVELVLKEQDLHPNWIATTIELTSDASGDQHAELTGYLHTETDVPVFVTPFRGCALYFALDGERLAVTDNKHCGGMLDAVVAKRFTRVSKVR
jgi:hypothetical protein